MDLLIHLILFSFVLVVSSKTVWCGSLLSAEFHASLRCLTWTIAFGWNEYARACPFAFSSNWLNRNWRLIFVPPHYKLFVVFLFLSRRRWNMNWNQFIPVNCFRCRHTIQIQLDRARRTRFVFGLCVFSFIIEYLTWLKTLMYNAIMLLSHV